MRRGKKIDRCPKCQASHFHLEMNYSKPGFRCTTACGDSWCWGYDGGEYFKNATNVADTVPSDWIKSDA